MTSPLGHQTSTSAYHPGFNRNSGVPPPGSVGNHSGVPGPPMTRQPQPMPGPMSSPMGGQQAKRIDPNQMPNPVSSSFLCYMFKFLIYKIILNTYLKAVMLDSFL